MKLGFLELSADERRVYFEQAASRRDMFPVIHGGTRWRKLKGIATVELPVWRRRPCRGTLVRGARNRAP